MTRSCDRSKIGLPAPRIIGTIAIRSSSYGRLAENYNATTWSMVPSVTVNANDVWAVGEFKIGTYYEPFSMNWNGSTWTKVIPPSVGGTGALLATRIPGSSYLWGVGASENANGSPHRTLIEKCS